MDAQLLPPKQHLSAQVTEIPSAKNISDMPAQKTRIRVTGTCFTPEAEQRDKKNPTGVFLKHHLFFKTFLPFSKANLLQAPHTVAGCLPTGTPRHPRAPYLLPDGIVTKEAADLSPGEWAGGVWVPVTWEHINAESFELTRVQCSEKEKENLSPLKKNPTPNSGQTQTQRGNCCQHSVKSPISRNSCPCFTQKHGET